MFHDNICLPITKQIYNSHTWLNTTNLTIKIIFHTSANLGWHGNIRNRTWPPWAWLSLINVELIYRKGSIHKHLSWKAHFQCTQATFLSQNERTCHLYQHWQHSNMFVKTSTHYPSYKKSMDSNTATADCCGCDQPVWQTDHGILNVAGQASLLVTVD